VVTQQTRYFTQSCNNLLIITDHKPLTKLFGERTFDEITNPRLLRIKQRALLWQFTIQHMPGKGNSDAISCNLVERPDERIDQYPDSTFLHSLHISDERQDIMETDFGGGCC